MLGEKMKTIKISIGFMLLFGLCAVMGWNTAKYLFPNDPITVHAQVPTTCTLNGSFTGVAVSAQIDNRTLGCYQWRLSYNSTGFSAISIQVEQAPDAGGVPGSWAAFTGTTVVTDGSNPSTNTNSAIIGIHSAAAWVRINLVSKTGTGTIKYQFWGANSTSNVASSKGGATGATGATGAMGATGATGPVILSIAGIPLINPVLSRGFSSQVGAGDNDLITCPASTTCLISSPALFNSVVGSTGTSFYEVKHSGTYYRASSNISLTSLGNNQSFAAIYLQPGDIFSINITNTLLAPLLNISYSYLQFSTSSALKLPCLFGLSTGNNTIYTAAKTASIFSSSAPQFLFSGSSSSAVGYLWLVTDSGGTRTYSFNSVPFGGTVGLTNQITTAFTNTANTRTSLSTGMQSLNVGDFININVDTGSASDMACMSVVEN